MKENLDQLSSLQELNVSGNQIEKLENLNQLSSLQNLWISHNKIEKLENLDQLSNLKKLDIVANPIKDLRPIQSLITQPIPVKWDNWSQSYDKGIYVIDCPLTHPPIEIAKQGNTAILSYFDSLAAGKKVRCTEIKILLLGEGLAGKTSLLKQFKGLPFSIKESQTHGINIEALRLGDLPPFQAHPSVANVTARFWDFGGQEVMHASHQFFMTQRSIYILLLDSRTDARKAYWLQHIQKYGGNSPTFVVMNKIDENPNYNIEQRTLHNKYPFIENRFFRISCRHPKEGFAALVRQLSETIPQTALFQTEIAEKWMAVKTALEQETADKHYIDEARFRAICQAKGVVDQTQQKTLLVFLNELGIVLHFDQLPLSHCYVLDPHWLTVAVYKIINSARIPQGILDTQELDYILNHEVIKTDEYDPAKACTFAYQTQEQAYILEVMESFELLYPLVKGKRYLIPDLLPLEPDTDLVIDATDDHHIHFVLQYDFLPAVIISRFIIQMNSDIFDLNQLWRTGVVLSNKRLNTTALVRADLTEKTIRICVAGNTAAKREYFAIIREKLHHINDRFEFKAGDIKAYMPISGHPKELVDYENLLGLERMGMDKCVIGKLGKTFSVSKDFLDKVSTREQRMKERYENERSSKYVQHNHFHGGQQNVAMGDQPKQELSPPPIVSEKPIGEKEQPKQWYEQWNVISAGVGILVFLLAWWFLSSLKVAALIGVVATIVMLFLNPDHWLKNLAQSSFAAFLGTLAWNVDVVWQQQLQNGQLDVQIGDPPVIASLALLVFSAVCIFFELRRSKV